MKKVLIFMLVIFASLIVLAEERLEVRSFETADGLKVVAGVYDNELGAYCVFDANDYCIPDEYSVYVNTDDFISHNETYPNYIYLKNKYSVINPKTDFIVVVIVNEKGERVADRVYTGYLLGTGFILDDDVGYPVSDYLVKGDAITN